jgi:two-component system sensor histidine kinase BarA
MGGEIGVDSKPGEGSRFWFRLPLPASGKAVAGQRRAAAGSLPEATEPHTWRGRRVLIVDDGDVNREIARQALAGFGIETAEARNGVEALSVMAAESFDIVLMDGSMPELDGFEATRRQRALDEAAGRPRRVILALTAHVVGEEAELWRAAGMDGVLHKPFTLETLQNCLVRFMSPHRAESTAGDTGQAALPDPRRRIDDLLDPLVLKSFTDMAAVTGPEPVRRIFGLFRDQAPGALENLCAAVSAGSYDQVARAAHAFRSMSLSIGARALARQLGEIERQARREVMPEARDLDSLAAVLDRSVQALVPDLTPPEQGAGVAA